jgi:GntR family transcriptional regulator
MINLMLDIRSNVIYHELMKIVLDHNSPVPLYHQIAEALSYHIATGHIPLGRRLPSVREAAASWNVNMHTVRRAYGELAERGLVEIRGPAGTLVVGTTSSRQSARRIADLDAFLQRVLQDGRRQHGLSRHDLVHLLANWSPKRSSSSDVVHVVECSETQCEDHVREIQGRWEVEARPWSLSRRGEPPSGPIIATYFHHNEVRRRWPHRLDEIHFAAIHPDPKLPTRLHEILPPGKRAILELCEFDEQMARNIAADLSVLFPPDRYHIKTRVVARGTKILESLGKRRPVLFSPRAWDALTAQERADPGLIKIVYAFTEEGLESLGTNLSWSRRSRSLHYA